jgi:hypothetical protein
MKIDILIVALLATALAGCEEISPPHQFAQPSRDWRVRSGQLKYSSPTTRLIGEVVVRFSKKGDLELTLSKGPGVTLLLLRQDANFAEAKGGMAGPGWAGPVASAPAQLQGWLKLREVLLRGQNRHVVRLIVGTETFLFRF